MKKTIGFIVLAAGQSRRFGQNKLLFPIKSSPTDNDTRPMLLHIVQRLSLFDVPILVVNRQNDTQVQQLLNEHQIPHVATPVSEQGMAHSLAFGIEQAAAWDGWLICLADMPCIQPDSYQRMLHAMQEFSLAVPIYQHHCGHPVGFSNMFYAELLSLQGDQGARALLTRHQNLLTHVPCPDPGILWDIDTAQDLAQLQSDPQGLILPPFKLSPQE
ncbi:MAG TPA: nucleotidyltransferase family protein [Pseudomonadales bacterium]|nr:nucleotidyltransferase family protein [Pseudomonadales bacterium]